jgi:peptidoglycan/xylan/chitin deacetylase (PgdA/CDA1 family)
MKAVMYHYVREPNPALPHFRFLALKDFCRQLDHFASQHGFVTREEWRTYVTTGQMPDIEGKVVLTFDDAMSCHYTHVFPELQKRDLWGIFYVPTGPYTGSGLLDVHRIHLLCGAQDGQALWDHAQTLVTEDMIPHARRAAFRDATYSAQINAPGVTEFKRLLNYFIDEGLRTSIIDRIAEDFGMGFDPTTFYVPAIALSHMAREGMLIGAHSVTHPVMSKLIPIEQQAEIDASLDWITRTVGEQDLRSYCHPYGGFHSFDDQTLASLDDHQVDFSFNVEPRDIVAADISRQRHALPRYDCNLFPHGQIYVDLSLPSG